MARLLYGIGGDAVTLAPASEGSDVAAFARNRAGGQVAANSDGSGPLTDLLAVDGITHITTISTDSNARPLFYGPDGFTQPYVYVSFGAGWIAVYAPAALNGLGNLPALIAEVDSLGSQIDALQTAVDELGTGVGGGGGTFDTAAAYSVTGDWTFTVPLIIPTPVAANHAATKGYVDGVGTSAPTAGTVAKRDSNGRLQVNAPNAPADVATKSYADALGVSIAATPDTIVRRKATSGAVAVGSPAADEDAIPKAWAASHLLAIPAIDATDGTAVPPGTPTGTMVLRLETPVPAPKWSSTGETSSGSSPLSWTVPASAVPGQTVVVVAAMAGTGAWTLPAGATSLYASATNAAGETIMVYGLTITSAMLGTAQQVVASTIPAGARAKVVALAYDGVSLPSSPPSLTAAGTATATPSIPGTAASGAGILLGLLVATVTATVADGAHWTWPGGWVEQYDDAVATTSSAATLSVTAATKTLTDAASAAAAAAPTSDLGSVKYTAVQLFLPAIAAAAAPTGSAGAGAGTDPWLQWYGRDPLAMASGAIARNPYGCPLSFNVAWPFGAGTGVCTMTPSAVDPREADSWTVTFVPSSGTSKTVTQPAMTRDAVLGVTNRPALTVA